MINDFVWKIGGPAGYGIMSTGLIFSRTFSKKGYNVNDYNEYPSLIRGGHNTYTVRVCTETIYSIIKNINILVALNMETVELHFNEVIEGGYIIFEGSDDEISKFRKIRKDINYIMVPFTDILNEINAPKVMLNNISLGASIALVDYDFEALRSSIQGVFKRKGEDVVNMNLKAAESGYSYIKNKLKIQGYKLAKSDDLKKMLVTGNDAVFMGAVRSGCKFYCAYPMTPSSSILASFASHENDYNIVVKHAESEIAVINMAVGASFAGARAMVATSGGGFSLMNEGISAAAMTETPIVVVLAQRPAPATGLPTWTEQGDMLFAIHASHGEFVRIVIAPGDPVECFYLTGKAFNLADRYQIPVIILLDKYLSESNFTNDGLDSSSITIDRGYFIKDSNYLKKDYKRYEITPDGISPRALAGIEGGVHIANTDEHNEYGFSEESSINRKNMMNKRFRKMDKLIKEIPAPAVYGPPEAEITLISWGSCKGPVLEALKFLNKDKNKVNFVHFTYLHPFPSDSVSSILKNCSTCAVIENNKTSQLSKLIRMNTGYNIENRILKYDGRQFLPDEIILEVDKL